MCPVYRRIRMVLDIIIHKEAAMKKNKVTWVHLWHEDTIPTTYAAIDRSNNRLVGSRRIYKPTSASIKRLSRVIYKLARENGKLVPDVHGIGWCWTP